jgi:UDP-glucose 4-epimerase
MARYVVTGGAGFIGSHLVGALARLGHDVCVVDNFSTGSPDNLAPIRDQLEVVAGDIRDQPLLQRVMRQADVVFHQAALASVPRSIADPESTHDVCATGTLSVLMAARAAGVRRVVYAASSSAYGNSPKLPKQESDAVNPASPYAVAKLAGEHYCTSFTEVYGLDTVRLRYFNVFGPRQPPDSPYSAVIPKFIATMLQGQPPTVHGDGRQSRDFTYVDNVVEANLLAAHADSSVSGKVFNIACGRSISLRELIGQLNSLLESDFAFEPGPPRAGEVMHSRADISRARIGLGYRPRVGLVEGLQRCLEYYGALAAAAC